MSEIIDVVTRLTYDVNASRLTPVLDNLQQQGRALGVLSNQVQRLERIYASIAPTDTARRQRVLDLINRQRQALDQQNTAITRQIANNRQLQSSLERESGIINSLQGRYRVLQQARDAATDPARIRELNGQLQTIQTRLSGLTGSGAGSQVLNSVLQGFGIGSGIALLNQGIGAISDFVSESSRLAAETEGVEKAFNRLNEPGLIDNLREATRGTVSDLELMKQAVQFSNFGLPLDKLATGLNFARVRARETGQSVDYLVQSIVTGIGRQSPLILDNLGVSALRVRQEFEKTGNFAEAAFKIISEESAKAGADLETFAEKQGRITAQIENTQAAFGKFYNGFKGYIISLGQDLGRLFTDNEFFNSQTQSEKYVEAIRAAKSANEDLAQIQNNSNVIFIQSYQRFLDDYRNADFKGREIITQQARNHYQEQLKWAAQFYKADLRQLEFYQQSQNLAFQRFNTSARGTQLNLRNVTPGGVKGLTREQLEQLQESIGLSRNSLSTNNAGEITRLNALSAAIKSELDIISGSSAKVNTNFKSGESAAKKYQEALAALRLEIKKLAIEFKTIKDEDIANTVQMLSGPNAGLNSFVDILENRNSGALPGFSSGVGNNRETASTRQLEAQAGIASDVNEKRKKDEKELAEKRIDNNQKVIESYYILTTAVTDAFNQITAAQIASLDREIAYRESRVSYAVELANRGNVEILNAERSRLEEAQKTREKLAQRQLQVNALLQASNSAVALTEAIGAIVAAAAKGDPYTIALRVAAAVASLVAGIAAIKGAFSSGGNSFRDGVVGFNGRGTATSDSNPVFISNGESVITARATKMHAPLLKAMNAGLPLPLAQTLVGSDGVSRKEHNTLVKKLDTLIDVTGANHTTVHNKMDGNGWLSMTERTKRKERNRFR